jgi:cyclo(L-tyrosyl-L-tyrosyl) synthase
VSERTYFSVRPFTGNCRAVYKRREHVVLGVSPGNSYFRVPLLTDLLGWLGGEFARVDVVIPDSALLHAYAALGYSAERAATKARGELNAVRNRVVRAWQAHGGPRPADGLHMMSDLVGEPAYRSALARCEAALAEDGELRAACRAVSRDVLLSQRPGIEPAAEQVEKGMRYLIAELPFFVASADIFGVPSSLCFYHRPLPLADLIFAGNTALTPSSRQAYAIIRPAKNSARGELSAGRSTYREHRYGRVR